MSASTVSVGIVGAGARTPLGLDAPSSSAAVRGAISAIAEHPFIVDKAGEPMCVAMDRALPAQSVLIERMHELAGSAILEALAVLPRAQPRDPIPVVIGLPEGRPSLPRNLGRQLASRLEAVGPTTLGSITTIAKGHASGLMALAEARRLVQTGEAELCLAGGVDSYLDADTLEWLDSQDQLMSAENRSGFVPGEAAGFCLIASSRAARRERLKFLADVVAVATTKEPNRIKTETVCTGKGLAEAITRVTASLRLPREQINFTYCDMNGERYRSEEFSFAVLRTQSAFVETSDNWTPADCWGDVGAASGPLYACLAIASSQRGYALGPRSLLWTSSEGGERCAALLQLPARLERGQPCPA
jgi:3-oxoacyl-[acyl-carrier-protein] synthase-1